LTLLLVIALFGFAAGVVIRGINTIGGIFEYPTLFTVILIGFLGPQVFWVISADIWLPERALEKALFMAFLATVATVFGFHLGRRGDTRSRYEVFSVDGLNVASAVASVVGIGFLVALNFLPQDVLTASQWSGLPTAYLFFGHASAVALAVSAMVYAITGRRLALYVCVANSLVIVDRALAFGRRGDLSEWLFIVTLAFWFGKSRAPSKAVVIAAIVASALLLNFIGMYRAAVAASPASNSMVHILNVDWGQLFHVGWTNALQVQDDTASELRNAARDIDVIDEEKTFDFGFSLWNTLVFNYFPAQVFGESAKSSLYIDLESTRLIAEAYEPWAGSTKTGLSDSFASFWYFGAMIFGFIAFVMGRLYSHARAGSFVAALLYMSLLRPALHALTHHTHWFLASVPSLLLFLVPILVFARFPKARVDHPTRSGLGGAS
jgi:hypothetical protein